MLYIPCRYVLCGLMFFGFVNLYTMKLNISVAILAMVKANPIFDHTRSNVSNLTVACSAQRQDDVVQGIPSNRGEFEWDATTRGNILGSFSYGFIVTNIPGGRISEILGVKWTFGGGVLSTAILTLLTPEVARWSSDAFIVLRVVQGLGEGVTFPAFYCLMGRWFPVKERGLIYAIILSGGYLGSLISRLVTGILCDSTFMGGWPSAFYVFGISAFAWCAVWFAAMYEYPKDNPRISDDEKKYILSELEKEGHATTKLPLPWKSILKSPPVWAVFFAMFGFNWLGSFDSTMTPTFLSEVLHANVEQIGAIAILPSLTIIVVSIISSALADWLIRRRKEGGISVTTIRKIFSFLGSILTLVLSICLILSGCDPILVIVLTALQAGASGFCYSGFKVAQIDMSPTFAGSIMGIINGVTQVSGFIVPLFVTTMTGGNSRDTLRQWHIVLITNSLINMACTLVFLVFGTSEVQSWSKEKMTTQKVVTEENCCNHNLDVIK